jgi:predicted DNA binding protein
MRKVTVEIKPNQSTMKAFDYIWEKIDYIRMLELIKFDIEKEMKLVIWEINVKDGYTIDDVELPNHVEILNILKTEGTKYTCIGKSIIQEEKLIQLLKDTDLDLSKALPHLSEKDKKNFQKIIDMMKQEWNLDVIWSTPNYKSKYKIIHSCIGDQENIRKYLDLMKLSGEIANISFQNAAYQAHDIISVLTEKQRDILIAAHKYGYYDYPKKISSEKLSQKVNISKATLVQHLRKAEGRLLDNILVGY